MTHLAKNDLAKNNFENQIGDKKLNGPTTPTTTTKEKIVICEKMGHLQFRFCAACRNNKAKLISHSPFFQMETTVFQQMMQPRVDETIAKIGVGRDMKKGGEAEDVLKTKQFFDENNVKYSLSPCCKKMLCQFCAVELIDSLKCVVCLEMFQLEDCLSSYSSQKKKLKETKKCNYNFS